MPYIQANTVSFICRGGENSVLSFCIFYFGLMKAQKCCIMEGKLSFIALLYTLCFYDKDMQISRYGLWKMCDISNGLQFSKEALSLATQVLWHAKPKHNVCCELAFVISERLAQHGLGLSFSQALCYRKAIALQNHYST